MIDLKTLLSSRKAVPVYQDREGCDLESMGPVAVEFHWTSACNFDCIHCSYQKRRYSTTRLSKGIIDRLLEDVIRLGTKAVYLSGGGEPTMVRHWNKYAETLLAGKVDVALITNGELICEEHAATVRKMNYVAISVYSAVPDEYFRITGGKNPDVQFSLPKIIKSRGNRAIVGARCVINRVNFNGIFDVYCKAMESGFDYVIFIPAVDYEASGISLLPEQIDAVKRIIAETYDKYDFRRTNIDVLQKRGVYHYSTTDYRANFRSPPEECTNITMRGNAFVNYDGGVYLCQPHIGLERFCVGNLNEKPFAEIWNSERHEEVVGLLNAEFVNGNCKNCRSIAFNVAYDMQKSGRLTVNPDEKDYFI